MSLGGGLLSMVGLSLLSVGSGMPWWEYEAAMVDDGRDELDEMEVRRVWNEIHYLQPTDAKDATAWRLDYCDMLCYRGVAPTLQIRTPTADH